MSLRATLALLVVALALGLYVYFEESGGGGGESAEPSSRIFQVEAEEISALEIALEGGGSARLTRAEAGDAWRLESPIEFPADAEKLAELRSGISTLESSAVIDDPPEDLEPFGLGASRRPVRFSTVDGQTRVFYLGGETPIGARRYLSVEGREGQILTVDEWRTRKFVPELSTLRDGRMVSIRAADVTALRISAGGALVLAAGRAGDSEWRLTEPLQDRADQQRVTRLLEDFDLARATGFIDEPGDLSAYGLAPSQVEVVLVASDGRSETVQMGEADGQSYLRIDDGTLVYEIVDRIRAGVPRELFTLRHKQVFEVAESEVQRIELEFPRSNARFAFQRGDPTWEPVGHEQEVEPWRLEDVTYAVSDLQAIAIPSPDLGPASLGLDPPRVRVQLADAEGESLGTLEFGDPDPEAGVAVTSSQSDRVWTVANRLAEDIPMGLEAFQNLWIEPQAEP